MNKNSIDKLMTVHPILIEKIITLINRANPQLMGIYKIIVTDGLRSMEDQQQAYDTGKSKAIPGHSYHNYGLAVDLAFQGINSNQLYYDDDKAWNILNDSTKGLGLNWGGDFKSIIDKPHFEWPILSIQSLLNIYKSGDDLKLFWDQITKIYLSNIA